MSRGAFIVLEGIDGSGTTTQAALLAESLQGCGHAVLCTREPTDGPVGRLLRSALTSDLRSAEGEPLVLGWATLALLFAADRLDHVQREIEPALAAGRIVICDRYDLSSVIYQSATAGVEEDVRPWVLGLNGRARRPDITLVLNLPERVARTRRQLRSEQPELFEVSELQQRLAAEYQRAPRLLPRDSIVCLSGEGTELEVAERIRQALAAAPEFAWIRLDRS